MTIDRRADALRELCESQGWQMLKDECVRQWGPSACFERLERELSQLPKGDPIAHDDAVAQVVAVKNAIQSMLEWPSAEYKRLSSDAAKDNAPVPIVPRRAGGNR